MTENAITLLTQDHRAVEKLFRQYEALGDGLDDGRETLVAQITHELSVHAEIEEVVFYPSVRAIGEKVKDEVLEAIEEHRVIKTAIARLRTMTPADESFDATVKVLMEQVKHHVKEEEEEMFPRVRRHVEESALLELGDALTQAKELQAAAGGEYTFGVLTALSGEGRTKRSSQ